MLKVATAGLLFVCGIFTGVNGNISDCSNSTTSIRLEDRTSGRVEVCWHGEWRGLSGGSIRTTQQANAICKRLDFLSEGAEILEGAEESPNSTTIYCSFVNKSVMVEDCYNTCSTCSCHLDNKTVAAIKCKMSSRFSNELIVLTVLVPILLCVILVGILALINLLRKVRRLNVIIHQLIYKQQKLRAGLGNTTLEGEAARSSMYAKPIINGGTGEESRARENVKDATDRTLTGLSQYSLLGNDKYENVAMDLKKIKAAP